MDRLRKELQRLYGPAEGPDRALVLQVAGPAAWAALSRVWQGVQADLQWPAPAIAIDGRHAYQLWFSLAQPVAAGEAMEWLAALRARYLADVPRDRVETWAQPPAMPPSEVAEGRWSAFVAPDLAALFAEEPWLDLAPGAEAQADLLATVQVASAADWTRAHGQLVRPVAAAGREAPREIGTGTGPAAGSAPNGSRCEDPRRFLLDVMNDASVDLPLRIEAAKALLRVG